MKYFAAFVNIGRLQEIWIHLALIYKGPEDQHQGIIIYRDGIQEGRGVDILDYGEEKHPSGVFKIGRLFDNPSSRYSEVMVGELSI